MHQPNDYSTESTITFENLRPSGKGLYLSSKVLLSLAIPTRLILGFLIPTLIAASASGIIGFQSSQLLSREASFYQSLFNTYASLTQGDNYLQLMNAKVHSTLTDAAVPGVSHETLDNDQIAIQKLADNYDNMLSKYTHGDLLDQQPDQLALLNGTGLTEIQGHQRSLAASVTRTWTVYNNTQTHILQDIQNGNLAEAVSMEHVQGEPTQADALSALHTLIQFHGDLVNSARDAANNEQFNLLITTLVSILLMVVAIGLVGWLISSTLIPRLHHLRDTFQQVENGNIHARVQLEGRDEITDLSTSVNVMLDTVVGLLEETRKQHKALVSASQRLFADMRVINGEELRAAADADPIGMLANAFNFTVGRFRRFVLRNQTSIEQLEVIARQQAEGTEAFFQTFQHLSRSSFGSAKTSVGTHSLAENEATSTLTKLVQQARENLKQIDQERTQKPVRTVMSLSVQAYQLCKQLQRKPSTIREDSLSSQQWRKLEMVLASLGEEMQTLSDHAVREIIEVDTALNLLAAISQKDNALHGSKTNSQIHELTRLIECFTQNSMTQTKQLNTIIKEMHSSLAPFLLEATAATT